jgi:hypothetical protein
MGHAIMYRIFFKEKNWHVTIGKGKPIINLKKFTIRVIPLGGFCKYLSNYKGTKLQYIMASLGGQLANLLFIALLIFLSNIIKVNELTIEQQSLLSYLEFTILANVYSLVLSAIPIKLNFWPFNGYVSDGMRILKTVREKSNG